MPTQKFKKLTLVVSCLLLILMPSQSGLAEQSLNATNLEIYSPGDIGWSGNFFINGVNQIANAVAIDGRNIYVAGSFTVAGNIVTNRIAMWDGSAWHPLGSGMNGPVTSLAVDGRGHLYAAGSFSIAGGTIAKSIARWDGQQWEALGGDIDGKVFTIAVDAFGNIYVGGRFSFAGSTAAENIAKWDGASWYALGEGIDVDHTGDQYGFVFSLAIDRLGFVYAGGSFNLAGGKPANNIARWDGAGWSALGEGISGGLNPAVYALATDPRGNLYVGGQFTFAGSVATENVARWNGDSWLDVGGGIQSSEKIKAAVDSIVVDGGTVYVGGTLTSAGGLPISGIAKWDGTAWDNLNGGIWRERYTPYISCLAIDRDGRIFAVGNFSFAGSVSANNVGVWDGSQWSGLGSDYSVNASILGMASDNKGGLFVGGLFTSAGGNVVNKIAQWNGMVWSGLDGGVSGGQYGPSVKTLAVDKIGNLYAGGNFTQAGDIPAQNIAKWTGNHWESLGSGVNGSVNSLAVDSQNNLYVGGAFLTAGEVPVNYVAKWTGSTWEALGSGLDAGPHALAVDVEDRLIAGGYFRTAGGAPILYLARWNGSSWEAMTDKYVEPPNAFLVKGDTLYWVGSAAWKIHDGVVERVGDWLEGADFAKVSLNALAFDRNDHLLVGGVAFTLQGDPSGILRRWNGNNWEPLGSGTDGIVNTMGYDGFGTLDVGGEFSLAGGKVSQYFAQWNEPFYQWLPLVGN